MSIVVSDSSLIICLSTRDNYFIKGIFSFTLYSYSLPQYWKHLFGDIMIIIQASLPLLYDVPPFSHTHNTKYKHMKTLVQEHVYMCHRGKHKKKKNRGRRNYSAKSVSDSGCLCLNCLKSPYIAATSKSIVLILYLTSCYKKQYLIC